jgi:hypothetical protein
MTTIDNRVLASLGSDSDSPWESLLHLYAADPESFYQLACDGASPDAAEAIQRVAALASLVRSAVVESYELESSGEGATLVTSSGKSQPIPQSLVLDIREFLRSVEGKGNSVQAGKDYEGTKASEAEVRFKLGDRDAWDAERKRIQTQHATQPLVLRISDEEIDHLKLQPPYVTYGLLNCARKAILAPRCIFKGLKRGEGCPPDLDDGWAFCGKLRQAFDNQGHPFDAPQGMVYLVFANKEGFVFDWDWVQEDPHEEGSPIDSQIRFGDPFVLGSDAVLDAPRELQPGHFDATRACYSTKGDCIFCYMSDEVSSAERINTDLTVFYTLKGHEISGFKIKNVRRIIREDKSIVIDDVPDLTVKVDSMLVASSRLQKESNTETYMVVIRALHSKTTEPPTVTVPREEPALTSD